MTATLVATPDPDRRPRPVASGRITAGRLRLTVIPQQESPKRPSDPAELRRFIKRMGW
ncbi:hypothetical protein GCM10011583_18270 [Streptomyces camponoticapitis]|uniref:Uncharacterized protein n=1 Tax=Streptomyces camponoticapitis TaxID=1616125 RepID=A0ABQ2E1E9_9ACTN|nr:hypothetical protein [Streptomyces camponoticapitis]GGJ87014.1 hypothetical protein GCM10011583_18270 [Streptomyces camponoticapitis]